MKQILKLTLCFFLLCAPLSLFSRDNANDTIKTRTAIQTNKFVDIRDYTFVDMGTRTKDGKIVYWCTKELPIDVVWGDVSGSSDATVFFDGEIPESIAGDPRYDIVTKNFGKEFQMPTQEHLRALLYNVKLSKRTVKRNNIINGVPDWVQGQWMCAEFKGGTNYAISVKIEEYIASIITMVEGSIVDRWEGTVHYDNNVVRIRDLQLSIDNFRQALYDNNRFFKKVGGESQSMYEDILVLTSKKNGNEITMPLPSSYVQIQGDGLTISGYNPWIEHHFWTGDKDPVNPGYSMAAFFKVISDTRTDIGCTSIISSRKLSVRPIKIVEDVEKYRGEILSDQRIINSYVAENLKIDKELTKKYKDKYVANIPFSKKIDYYLEQVDQKGSYQNQADFIRSIRNLVIRENKKIKETKVFLKDKHTSKFKKFLVKVGRGIWTGLKVVGKGVYKGLKKVPWLKIAGYTLAIGAVAAAVVIGVLVKSEESNH